MKLASLKIQTGDFPLHKACPGGGTEATKINHTSAGVDLARQDCGDQTAVETGAAAAHQGDGCGGRQGPVTHGPVAQRQGMAVTTARQHQLLAARLPAGMGGGHVGGLPPAALLWGWILLCQHKCAFW